MAFVMKHQRELVAIVSAGFSVELSVKGRHQHDRIALAAAAKLGEAHLALKDVALKHQHELVAIGAAGKGHVTLRE